MLSHTSGFPEHWRNPRCTYSWWAVCPHSDSPLCDLGRDWLLGKSCSHWNQSTRRERGPLNPGRCRGCDVCWYIPRELATGPGWVHSSWQMNQTLLTFEFRRSHSTQRQHMSAFCNMQVTHLVPPAHDLSVQLFPITCTESHVGPCGQCYIFSSQTTDALQRTKPN